MSSYPAIPEPNLEPQGLLASVQALKQAVEMLTGQRNGVGQALVADDLPDLHPTAYTGVLEANSITSDMIQAMAVTYAKIQNVSATARILGRKTAGAGVVEECTLSQILDFVGSAANGDILFRSGGAWTRLPIGSNTNVLTLASGLPSWAAPAVSGGITLLSSASVGTGTTYSVTGLSGYKMFIVALRGVNQNVGTQIFQCALSGNNGSSYGTARKPVATGTGNGVLLNGFFFIDRVDQTNNQLVSTGQLTGGASNIETGSLGPINALQFSWDGAAAFGAGEIDIYGLK